MTKEEKCRHKLRMAAHKVQSYTDELESAWQDARESLECLGYTLFDRTWQVVEYDFDAAITRLRGLRERLRQIHDQMETAGKETEER